MNSTGTEHIEVDLVVEAIHKRYGYDFRNYARASLKRRLEGQMREEGMTHLAELIPALIRDDDVFERLLDSLSVTVTEMFRDPRVYLALRQQVLPTLETYPFLKIWHAGCATGEEVYSFAILLHEQGLLKRAQIYATDCNNRSLADAGKAIYPLSQMKRYTTSYNACGSGGSLADYYTVAYKSAKIHAFLRENVTFANHNLVCDGVFGEMHLIICRNVLIYFDQLLQERVIGLFKESLINGGFLCLGAKETLTEPAGGGAFVPIAARERIFQWKELAAGAAR